MPELNSGRIGEVDYAALLIFFGRQRHKSYASPDACRQLRFTVAADGQSEISAGRSKGRTQRAPPQARRKESSPGRKHAHFTQRNGDFPSK